MSDNSPLYALIAFAIISLFFGVLAYQLNNELLGEEPDGSKGKEAAVQNLKKDLAKAKEEVNELRNRIALVRPEVEVAQTKYMGIQYLYTTYRDDLKRRQLIKKEDDELAKLAVDLKNDIMTTKEATRRGIQEARAKDSQAADEVIKRNEGLKLEAQKAAEEDRKADETEKKKYDKRKNFEDSYLGELRSQLDTLIQRERKTTELQACGKVILCDPTNRLVVINIGSAAGVKRGYRFECFRIDVTGGRIFKAMLEVQQVQPNIAECIDLERTIELPRDPLTGYVASIPEEEFSPYATKGGRGEAARAQPLSGRPKIVSTGMRTLDPIVEGDLVGNPFFFPGKTVTWAVVGQAPLKYRRIFIERMILEYGGKVKDVPNVEAIGPGIDYVIAQKNADDEVRAATNIGIPVIYEFELFRFLDTR